MQKRRHHGSHAVVSILGALTMEVKVVQGDLLEQNVDAILNAWNRSFIPWWLLLPQGVSGAIRKHAGTKPFREVGRFGVLKVGQAVFTSAGRLGYKGIIHVAGLNAFWRSTESSIRQSTRNAVDLVISKGFQTIAFPLIGAGTGGFKTQRVRELMLSEFSAIDSAIHATVVEFVRGNEMKSHK